MVQTGQKPSRVVKQHTEINEQAKDLLRVAAGEYRKYKKIAEDAEEERKKIGVDLQAIMLVTGADTVQFPEFEVIKSNGRTGSKLSEQKLMEHGVDPDVIEECWEGGKSYTYAYVKEKEEGGGDSGVSS